MRFRTVAVVVAVPALAAGGACSQPTRREVVRAPASSSTISSTLTTGAPVAVASALKWEAPAVAEGAPVVAGASFAGRPVALWFWAPW